MTHIETGQEGERIARNFCIRRGWLIRQTNWRAGKGEIDIIAQDGPTTVFVEVKFRTSDTFGSPEEALTPHKQQILRNTISRYCAQFRISRFRVDVIAIQQQGQDITLRHLKDVELLSN